MNFTEFILYYLDTDSEMYKMYPFILDLLIMSFLKFINNIIIKSNIALT